MVRRAASRERVFNCFDYWLCEWCCFRAHVRAAPLKQVKQNQLRFSNPLFPRARARGSIEASPSFRPCQRLVGFPRARARGSIEAVR